MDIADFHGRSRPDACPGALQVHAAADGGLARVRVPGGRLTPARLRELATAARLHGDGAVELTSRANVQVRGLAHDDDPTAPDDGFAARMARAGLLPSATHERVRNILASPLTGLDGPGGGVADVTPLIGELDRRLCARPALAALPGRFMFALDDGRGDVAGLGADAAVLAVGPDRFALLLAGTDTGLRVGTDQAVTALLAAAEAFLDELAALDVTAWRISELPDGPALVTARVSAALPADPTADRTVQAPPSEPVRPRPVALGPVGLIGTAAPPGTARSGPARVALGVAVPLGRLTSAQAEVLADVASGGEIRLTPWRGAVLPGLTRAEAADAAGRLRAAGLVVDPGSPWIGVTACAGRPGCAKSLADVRADATAVVALAPPARDASRTDTLPVHWAGCARRCGRPKGRVADVVATGHGYRLELDGTGLTCSGIEETAAAVTAARGEL
ncbi:precorrin-3B synthase [Streptosporangium sp. NPDC050855]|uniref:precorrin-3B synthase n=1 Tax=Streptosporangium sp. NPDC050855 TaxID=3366194 RepID=UPI0037A13995